jgi:hypothetical protein
MLMPGGDLLTDVAVTHALAPGYTDPQWGRAHASAGVARYLQWIKHRKYDETAEDWGFRLLPLAVETTGGMAPDAVKLVEAMAEASEEQLGLWNADTISRHVHSLVAVDLSLYAEGVVVNSSTDMALCWPTVCGTSDGETRRERVQM